MTDNVNHPAHYESQRIVIEPIDLCECFDFCIGNAIKYLIRAGKKEGNSEEQDLAKARWYLKRALVQQVESNDYWPNGKKDSFLVSCAAYGYCAANAYVNKLFSPGALNPNFPAISPNGVIACIRLIDKKIGEEE